MLPISRPIGVFVSIAATIWLLSGCEKQTEMTDERENSLVQRVEARWQTINSGDFGAAWEFSTPSFKEIFPKQMYYMNFSQSFYYELTSVELSTYDSRAAVASVSVRVMAKPTEYAPPVAKMMGDVPDVIKESWRFLDGNWYFIDPSRAR